jgi:hypothetical protein
MFQSQNVNPYRCDSTLSYDDNEAVKCYSVREIVLTKCVCIRPFFTKNGRVWNVCAISAKLSINEVHKLYHIQ